MLFIFKIIMGGTIYYMLEILARGFSHWSMFILGGICFAACGIIHNLMPPQADMFDKMVVCMIMITLLEFITGIIVNTLLHLNVWDYSDMPLQLLGQICVPFMFLWFFISLPALLLNRAVDSFFMSVN